MACTFHVSKKNGWLSVQVFESERLVSAININTHPDNFSHTSYFTTPHGSYKARFIFHMKASDGPNEVFVDVAVEQAVMFDKQLTKALQTT